jgi:1-acyl-sn-glycerol-3-phosphate acyltransferase
MLSLSSILFTKHPYKSIGWFTNFIMRSVLLTSKPMLLRIHGLENLKQAKDPYIVVLNHNHYLESFILPAVLMWYRGGHAVRFLADWNFLLIPFVAVIFWSGKIIPVVRKDARPKFLNIFKPLLVRGKHGYPLAKQCLLEGQSVGVFPEGKINPNPHRMLKGLRGAAHLSLETKTPVLPIGIQFPDVNKDEKISIFTPMEIHIGATMYPDSDLQPNRLNDIKKWHKDIMNTIARLSNKRWDFSHEEKEHEIGKTSPSFSCNN